MNWLRVYGHLTKDEWNRYIILIDVNSFEASHVQMYLLIAVTFNYDSMQKLTEISHLCERERKPNQTMQLGQTPGCV